MQKLVTLRFALPAIVILTIIAVALIAIALFTHQVHVHVPGTAFDFPA